MSSSNRIMHGLTGTRIYRIWAKMWERCTKPYCRDYPRYGGRGITVCDRWKNPRNFLADMGEPTTSKHSLDRIDNFGNYEPGNCRWADKKTQARNRRSNVPLSYGGRTLIIVEWAELTGIPQATLEARVKRGWDAEATITTPLMTGSASVRPKGVFKRSKK